MIVSLFLGESDDGDEAIPELPERTLESVKRFGLCNGRKHGLRGLVISMIGIDGYYHKTWATAADFEDTDPPMGELGLNLVKAIESIDPANDVLLFEVRGGEQPHHDYRCWLLKITLPEVGSDEEQRIFAR